MAVLELREPHNVGILVFSNVTPLYFMCELLRLFVYWSIFITRVGILVFQ
jgi:hypothetical protein